MPPDQVSAYYTFPLGEFAFDPAHRRLAANRRDDDEWHEPDELEADDDDPQADDRRPDDDFEDDDLRGDDGELDGSDLDGSELDDCEIDDREFADAFDEPDDEPEFELDWDDEDS